MECRYRRRSCRLLRCSHKDGPERYCKGCRDYELICWHDIVQGSLLDRTVPIKEKESAMSFMHRLEHWDAEHGIPRPADAPHLTAYHATIKCFTIGAEMLMLLACGIATATCTWFSANFLEVTFETRLFFLAGMLIAVAISAIEGLQLL